MYYYYVEIDITYMYRNFVNYTICNLLHILYTLHTDTYINYTYTLCTANNVQYRSSYYNCFRSGASFARHWKCAVTLVLHVPKRTKPNQRRIRGRRSWTEKMFCCDWNWSNRHRVSMSKASENCFSTPHLRMFTTHKHLNAMRESKKKNHCRTHRAHKQASKASNSHTPS